jgi:hypothetical protein
MCKTVHTTVVKCGGDGTARKLEIKNPTTLPQPESPSLRGRSKVQAQVEEDPDAKVEEAAVESDENG